MSGFLPQHVVDQLDASPDGKPPERVKVLRDAAIFSGEAADFPQAFPDFVGQEEAKEQIMVFIASAIARETRLDHTLLAAGQHGIGKTTLAHLIAYQMGVGLVVTTGKGLSAEEFRLLVMPLKDGDIVFVDEFHMAFDGGRNKGDWLLPWMLGSGLKTMRGIEQTPDVTLIAATTDVGRAPETLLSRFMNTPTLSAYTATEGALLVGNLARRMAIDVEEELWPAIARAADCNPRAIRKILTKVRDLQYARPHSHPNLEQALTYAGVTADGLTVLARNILILLATKRNLSASAETLAGELGEPGSLRQHENALFRRGLIEITGQGRRLTDAGLRRAHEAFREVR